jgi:hypothetical protein
MRKNARECMENVQEWCARVRRGWGEGLLSFLNVLRVLAPHLDLPVLLAEALPLEVGDVVEEYAHHANEEDDAGRQEGKVTGVLDEEARVEGVPIQKRRKAGSGMENRGWDRK